MKKNRIYLFSLPILLFGILLCSKIKCDNWNINNVITFFQEDLLNAICKDFPLDIDDSKDLDIEEIVLDLQQSDFFNCSTLNEEAHTTSKFSPLQCYILDNNSSISSPPPEV